VEGGGERAAELNDELTSASTLSYGSRTVSLAHCVQWGVRAGGPAEHTVLRWASRERLPPPSHNAQRTVAVRRGEQQQSGRRGRSHGPAPAVEGGPGCAAGAFAATEARRPPCAARGQHRHVRPGARGAREARPGDAGHRRCVRAQLQPARGSSRGWESARGASRLPVWCPRVAYGDNIHPRAPLIDKTARRRT
jgi:hypothetical protein